MSRLLRILTVLGVVALPAASLAGTPGPQPAGVTLVKTVGTDPNACATESILAQVPEDGIVYYCYQMTYTGAISASSHTLIDSVLGNVLDNIPGSRCCTNASGTNCEEPLRKCSDTLTCPAGPFPVCAATTFPGICCVDESGASPKGVDCPIPHEGCVANADCGSGEECVTNPHVADGVTITRVITATISQGIANQATWSAQAGICCSATDPDECDGGEFDNAPLCDSDADCFGAQTCRKEGIGLCCDPSDPSSCASDRVCLTGRDCGVSDDPNAPVDPFTECQVADTTAEGAAAARVGVVDSPTLSATASALVILMLVGVGFSRLRRQESL